MSQVEIVVAPVWRRALAALIDAVPVLGLWLLATWAIVVLDSEPPEIPPWNFFDQIVDYIQAAPGRSALSLIVLAVFSIGWPLAFGVSLGKRVMRLGVIDRRGERPSLLRSLGWLTARLVGLALAGAGVWWAIVDPERRTLHDRVAGVWVTDRSARGKTERPSERRSA